MDERLDRRGAIRGGLALGALSLCGNKAGERLANRKRAWRPTVWVVDAGTGCVTLLDEDLLVRVEVELPLARKVVRGPEGLWVLGPDGAWFVSPLGEVRAFVAGEFVDALPQSGGRVLLLREAGVLGWSSRARSTWELELPGARRLAPCGDRALVAGDGGRLDLLALESRAAVLRTLFVVGEVRSLVPTVRGVWVLSRGANGCGLVFLERGARRGVELRFPGEPRAIAAAPRREDVQVLLGAPERLLCVVPEGGVAQVEEDLGLPGARFLVAGRDRLYLAGPGAVVGRELTQRGAGEPLRSQGGFSRLVDLALAAGSWPGGRGS